jgi:hypothetical protein
MHLSRVGNADYYSLPETCRCKCPKRNAVQAENHQCELSHHQVQSLADERFRPADSMEEITRCKLVLEPDARNFCDNVAVRNAANCSRRVPSVAKPAIFPHRKSNESKRTAQGHNLLGSRSEAATAAADCAGRSRSVLDWLRQILRLSDLAIGETNVEYGRLAMIVAGQWTGSSVGRARR